MTRIQTRKISSGEMAPDTTPRWTFRAGGHSVQLGDSTRIVGVVNITPDSFFDGGRYLSPERAVDRCLELADQGADFLDLGAESSRPGADPVSAAEEMDRLLPVLEGLQGRVEVPLMVDTCKPEVAQASLSVGAAVINDIEGLRNPSMAEVVASSGAGVVVMHMRGKPKIMQKIESSPDIWEEIDAFFSEALSRARGLGVSRDRIIVDPGIGFGKTVRDNLSILNKLHRLERFRLPILVGTSRKSFIGKILGNDVNERLWGTAASVSAAVMRGAHLVRVHDVAEMRQVVRITDSILAEKVPE